MFCSKCGSPIPDGYRFCAHCGNPVAPVAAPQPAPQQPAPEQPVRPVPEAPQYAQPQPQYAQPQPQYQYAQPSTGKKPLNKKLIGIIAGVAAAVIIAVVLIISLGGNGGGGSDYKSTAVNAVSAIYKDFDAKKFVSYFPDAIIKAELEETGQTRKEFIAEGQESFDDMKEMFDDEFGKKRTVTVKVADSEKYDKDDLADLNEELKDNFEKLGKVTEAYDVEVEIVISYTEDGEKETTDNSFDLTVGKIGGKWYIVDSDMF